MTKELCLRHIIFQLQYLKKLFADIVCLQYDSTEKFEAVLSLPHGYEAVPVFEDKPKIDPTTNQNCRTIPTKLTGMFQLIVTDYDSCGVRKCRQSNGEVRQYRLVAFKLYSFKNILL